MWFGSREDEVRRIEREALEHLEAGRLDEARALAERLLTMGWSGGFEVKALALQRAGDPDAAIAALEAGVEAAPDAWALWHLLGTLRSDAGRLDAALAALDRAAAHEDADAMAIRFNRAVVQQRRGEPGAALDALEPILALPRPPPFAEDALGLAAACLAELGRGADGVALVEAALERCAADDPRRARLDAERAVALDRAGEDAREAFERARDRGGATPALVALGRRLEPAEAARPRRFELVVDAPLAEASSVAGLFRVFDVVAEDVAHALRLCRPWMPPEARAAVRVDSHEVRDAGALEPGVHAVSPRLFYAQE